MLCDVCEDTFSRMLDSSENTFVHQLSHANLARSAANDCLICSGIIGNIAESNHQLGEHSPCPLTSWVSDSGADRKKAMHVQIWLDHRDDDCEQCYDDDSAHLVEIYDFTPVAIRARLGDREERRLPTVFSHYTDSAETTSHIIDWIEICEDTHDVCKEGRENMWMPSRLLEISGVRDDLQLRLRDRSELQSGRYCTLSHCWGAPDVQSLKLTTDSLSSFRNGIAASNLKYTFQEMADLTWQLGVRLMWIDCMCIIQDDSQDWRYESALMGKVYANSWLNVSAASRDSSRTGLYAERYATCHVAHFRTRHDQSGEATTWTVTNSEEWWFGVETAPVNGRAWVLQERILSPRIVHMSSDQVLWECRQLQASEHLPYGGHTYEKQFASRSRMKRICYGSRDKDQDDACADWGHLVEIYSYCGLTFETDRLIALSGIASMVHKRTQCEYLAGIWRKALPIDLLWRKRRTTATETAAKTMINEDGSAKYVAPSWSWASAIEVIDWTRYKANSGTCATVRRCETSLANPADKFGAVLAGMIEMRAPLGTLNWIGRHGNNYFGKHIVVVTDIELSILMESGRTEVVAQWSSIPEGKEFLFIDREEYLDLRTAYFTVIRTRSEALQHRLESDAWIPGYNVEGLLLKRLPCSRFVRIGVAFLEFDTEQDFISKMPEQDVIII